MIQFLKTNTIMFYFKTILLIYYKTFYYDSNIKNLSVLGTGSPQADGYNDWWKCTNNVTPSGGNV